MCVFSIKSDNLKSVGTGCVGNVKREDIEVVELKFSKNNNSSILPQVLHVLSRDYKDGKWAIQCIFYCRVNCFCWFINLNVDVEI